MAPPHAKLLSAPPLYSYVHLISLQSSPDYLDKFGVSTHIVTMKKRCIVCWTSTMTAIVIGNHVINLVFGS